ncbi:MAG: hypothetical protein NDI81_06280 [Desulfobacula sp.]|nr:hypothetical protein [Desulfobacula sp.]
MCYKILTLCLVLFAATTVFASTKVLDAHKANPSDVAQAEKFLRDLPNACSGSYAYASSDGTVNIRVICIGSTKTESMDGLIAIKNGVVTQVK